MFCIIAIAAAGVAERGGVKGAGSGVDGSGFEFRFSCPASSGTWGQASAPLPPLHNDMVTGCHIPANPEHCDRYIRGASYM